MCASVVAQIGVSDIRVTAGKDSSIARVRFGLDRSERSETGGKPAVWVFAKYLHPAGDWRGVRWSDDGHSCVERRGGGLTIDVGLSPPRHGLMITSQSADPIDVAADLSWDLDASGLEWTEGGASVRVFAIDMVEIPGRGYDVRAADGAVSPLRSSDGSNLRIMSEGPLGVGDAAGLTYESSDFGGDQRGPIPEAFPKGVGTFYVMRNELTEGEYGEFLSTLAGRARLSRDITAHPGYIESGGSIVVRRDSVEIGSPERPAGFVSWADGIAWASWAGLRPMSELEFEKIVSDADAFGVRSMRGGRWERVVTLGSEEGRAFRGSEGSGFLDDLGQPYVFANWDWPGPRAVGSGFRGGFGEGILTTPGDRTYAAYEATYGNEHEGFRAVRDGPVEAAAPNLSAE